MEANDLSQKIPLNFCCEKCDYVSGREKDFLKHCSTQKHKRLMKANDLSQLSQIQQTCSCICGNVYKHMSSLCKHKKICKTILSTAMDNMYSNLNKDELIITLLKQNAELIKGQQDIFMKLSDNQVVASNQTNNINNSMNNNKTFNLQFFLNETCKDAMDITEFVNNMKLELDDLENTGKTGYVEGISNIVIKNLNKIEQHLRPLHCGDFKREVLYIKHNNEWTKESDNKPILTRAIKSIANENIKQISKWKDKYPDCIKSSSKKNDLYLKIVSNSMNGLTKEEGDKNIIKIISNVAKQVVIEK